MYLLADPLTPEMCLNGVKSKVKRFYILFSTPYPSLCS